MGCFNSKNKTRPSRQERPAQQAAQDPVLQIPGTLAPVRVPNPSATTSTANFQARTEEMTRRGHAVPIAQNTPSVGGTTPTQPSSAPHSHYSPPVSGNTASPSAIVREASPLRPSSNPRPHYIPDTHGAMSRSSTSGLESNLGLGSTPGPAITARTSATASTVRTTSPTAQLLPPLHSQEFQATQQGGRGRGRGRGR